MSFANPSEKIISIVSDNKVLLLKAAVVLASVIALYYSDLELIFGNALKFTTGNISNYVLTIPLMSGFIIFRKRSILKAVAVHGEGIRARRLRFDDVLGITLCVVAILIYLASSATLYALEYHILTLPIFIAGAAALVFNVQTLRHSLVAILLTLYIQPPPGQLVSELAADLSWTSSVIVQSLLSSLGLPVSLDSSFGAPALILQNAAGNKVPFFVGEPSSGVFSTIGLSLFAIFVAYIIRGPTWKRIMLFLTGFPIFFLLNTLRIALVLVLWHIWGETVSEAYHTISGSSMVAIGTLIVLIVGEKIFKLNIRTPSIKRVPCALCAQCLAKGESMCISCGRALGKVRQVIGKSTERIAFIIFIALVTTLLIMGGMYGKLDSRNLSNLDIAVLKGPETTQYLLPQVSGWDLSYAYRDTRVESILNQDAALAYRYTITDPSGITQSTKTGAGTTSLYASIQISTGHHVWEDSLVTYPSRVGRPGATLLDSEEISIADGKDGRFLMFKREGSTSTESVVYWFERTPLKFGNNFENRNVLISIWGNTDSLAKTGIIGASNDSISIKKLYLSLARPIAAYWDEQSSGIGSSNELIYAFVNKNLVGLSALAVFPLIAFSVYQARYKATLSSRLNRLSERLVLEERSFFLALASFDKDKGHHTGEYIRKIYANNTNRQLSNDRLAELLQNSKKAGLVKNVIESAADQSLLVWKLTFKPNQDGSQHSSLVQRMSPFRVIKTALSKMRLGRK